MELENKTACYPPKDSYVIFVIRNMFGYFNVFSTGIVLIIAITSWILIPRWRSYRNFIFFNLFLTEVLLIFCFMDKYFDANVFFHSLSKFLRLLGRYVNFVYFCWLFLFSINIYMDSVHFKINLTWKFVKSSAFAWGLPLILNILLIIVNVVIKRKTSEDHKKNHHCHRHHHLNSSLIIKLALEIILLAVNFCAYLAAIFILLKQRDRGPSSEYRRIYIVTRTFVICIVLWLISVVLEASISKFHSNNLSDVYSTYFIMHCTQNIYLKLYFLLSKSNCKRWRKYFRQLCRSHQRRETLQMLTVD